MDHLKSSQERRDRWYSKQWPRYIPIIEARDWADALEPQETYHFARSIPFDWLTKSSPSDIQLQSVLQQHGFAVISGVLSKNECQKALSLGWDYLEAASAVESMLRNNDENSLPEDPPLKRNDLSTHTKDNMPRSVEGGMLSYYGSGHSTLAWFIRSHPNVVKVFSSLHGTNDLISSLDGIVLWFKNHRTDAGWFHIDQHPVHKPNPCSVQGLVNLLPVTKGTGGNVLVAHSHSHFPQHYLKKESNEDCFYRERMVEVGTDDWLEVDPNDTKLLQPQHLLSLLLSPGDLLLWDSRTVHCSYPGKEDEKVPDFDGEAYSLIRAGVLVSMMPRDQVDESVLQDRVEAVHQCRTLTHWANKVAPLGEERPDDVSLESRCIKNMKAWQEQRGKPVLLAYNDLTRQQQTLVAGNDRSIT